MKYILMCGGDYHTPIPKQLRTYGTGLTIIERTIRFLEMNGVEDIAISTNDERFEQFGLPIIHHFNTFGNGGHWLEGFCLGDFPCCYIFGDVFFSPMAIKKIVETETDDIEFFASAPPFSKDYIKSWAEPFAFKVNNPLKFRRCVNTCIQLANQGAFKRDPISWELWQVIKKTPLNEIDYTNYTVINDYTTDFDDTHEFIEFKNRMRGEIE